MECELRIRLSKDDIIEIVEEYLPVWLETEHSNSIDIDTIKWDGNKIVVSGVSV